MRPRKSRPTCMRTFERLEVRQVLSASLGNEVFPNLLVLPAATPSTPGGLTPAQAKAAYGFNSITFGNVVGDGAGQTIAIVDAYNDPNILADLAKFDAQFGLPAPPSIKVVNQTGGSSLPRSDRGWAAEIALDVEWAHAIAPGANILLVEANSAYTADLNRALDYARSAPGVVVVSNSWGGSEYSTESTSDVHFTTPAGHAGVTFTVAAGDDGAPAEYPSSSPNVLSVGGTTLRLTSSNAWSSETVWSDGGGGTSRYEGLPSYQKSLGLTNRGTPDVSYDANPSTGFAVYDSYGSGGWAVYGGTSVGAPQWAALIAIVDQGRALSGKGSLSNAQAAVYALPRGDFHDITSGSNGYSATSGYDVASGLGSPIANLVVRDLVAYNGSPSFSVASAVGQTPVRRTPWWWWGSFSGFGFFGEAAGSGTAAAGNGAVADAGMALAADSRAVAGAAHGNATADPTAIQTAPVASSNSASQCVAQDAQNSALDNVLFGRGHRAGSSGDTTDSVLDAYFAALDGANVGGRLIHAA